MRMPHELVCELHVCNSRLIRSGPRLLKGRKAHKELLNHLLVPFFRKNLVHILIKTLVVRTNLLIFTNFMHEYCV